MSRNARWVLAVVIVQAALVGLYVLVEHRRAPSEARALGTEPPQRVDVTMPSLQLQRRDGSIVELSPSRRPTLVHVWATWCPPCRAELPDLLELPTKHPVDVVAIALDQSWADVDRFLGQLPGGLDASTIILARSEDVERALGVRSLPVTFVMQPKGRLTLRFDGARDWTDEAFIATYIEKPLADQ